MKKWLTLHRGDHRALEKRLDRLGEKGLVLQESDGSFFADFHSDTSGPCEYLVLPLTDSIPWEKTVTVCEKFGWGPVSRHRGMAILRALPCRDRDKAAVWEALLREKAVIPPKKGMRLPLIFGIAALISAVTAVLWYPALSALFPKPWYLSHTGALMHIVFPVWLILFHLSALLPALHTLISRRSTPALALAGDALLAASVLLPLTVLPLALLDLSASGTLFLLLGLGVTVALITGVWQTPLKKVGLVLGIFAFAVTLFGAAFPNVSLRDYDGALWRQELTNCLRLDDVVQRTDRPLGAEYETGGSVPVRYTSYYEVWDDAGVSSFIWHCLFPSAAEMIEREQLAVGEWTELSEGCYATVKGDTQQILFRNGNNVVLITVNDLNLIENYSDFRRIMLTEIG